MAWRKRKHAASLAGGNMPPLANKAKARAQFPKGPL